MTRAELDACRLQLLSLREELSAQLKAPDSTSGSISPDKAIGRLTRMEALQAQQMNAAGRRRVESRMALIAKALEQIEDGTYGTCVRCGSVIPPGRLQIRPESRLCVRCAARG